MSENQRTERRGKRKLRKRVMDAPQRQADSCIPTTECDCIRKTGGGRGGKREADKTEEIMNTKRNMRQDSFSSHFFT